MTSSFPPPQPPNSTATPPTPSTRPTPIQLSRAAIVDSSPSDLPLSRSKMFVPGTSPALSVVVAAPTPKHPTQPVPPLHLASLSNLPPPRSHASQTPMAFLISPRPPEARLPSPQEVPKQLLACRYPRRHSGALELLHRTAPPRPHGRAILSRPNHNHSHPSRPGRTKHMASREVSHPETSRAAPMQLVPRPPTHVACAPPLSPTRNKAHSGARPLPQAVLVVAGPQLPIHTQQTRAWVLSLTTSSHPSRRPSQAPPPRPRPGPTLGTA